jgi:hypothetical protein
MPRSFEITSGSQPLDFPYDAPLVAIQRHGVFFLILLCRMRQANIDCPSRSRVNSAPYEKLFERSICSRLVCSPLGV